MSATIILKRTIAAFIVGATGKNVLRVIPAFDRYRLVVSRADTVEDACRYIPRDLPLVVLSLAQPKTDADARMLVDVAAAVGATLFHLDPQADDATFQRILDEAVKTTLQRQRAKIAPEPPPITTPIAPATENAPSLPPLGDVDDDWDK